MICKGMASPSLRIPKPVSVGLTGIMILKTDQNGANHISYSGYKSRYKLSSMFCEKADGSICVKRNVEAEDQAFLYQKAILDGVKFKPVVKKRSKKSCSYSGDMGEIEKKVEKKSFQMNKKEVRHRVMQMFNCLCNAQKLRMRGIKPLMYFWTVSFREGTSEDNCYQLLNIWLTQLRQKKRLRSYLWVAEKQKNGTTHFHVLIPHYLNIRLANSIMKTSICGLIRKGVITDWPLSVAKRYNGVDIAGERKAGTTQKTGKAVNFAESKRQRLLHKYITKYISKNDDDHCRQPWHCSRDWSALVKYVHLTLAEKDTLLYGERIWIKDRPLESEFMRFYAWLHDPPDPLCQHFADLNYEILSWVLGYPEGYLYSLN